MKKILVLYTVGILTTFLSAQTYAEVIARDGVTVMEIPHPTVIIIDPRENDDCDCDDGFTMEPSTYTRTEKGGLIRKIDTAGLGSRYYYSPAPDADPADGPDSFTYTLRNNAGESSTAKQFITLIPKPAKPKGVADSFTAVSGKRTLYKVTNNDIGKRIRPSLTSNWSLKGGKVFAPFDSFTKDLLMYTSKPGFVGEDKVWYTVENTGGTDWAEVTINVVADNTGPALGIIDPIRIPHSTPQTIDVLENDIGNGLVLNAPHPWTLKGGKVSLVDNKLLYTPKAGFINQDKIWYSFKDAEGRTSWSEVRVNLFRNYNEASNVSPYPESRPDTATTIAGKTVAIDVLANDLGSNLTIPTKPLNAYSLKGGLVATYFDGIGYRLYYTPKSDFTGEDKIWYPMKDDRGFQNWGEVTINVTAN